MRIRDFASTLVFALTTLREDREDDNVNFEKNFNSIMKKATEYIRKIAKSKFGEKEPTIEELNELVITDYNRILDETYQNSDIQSYSLEYLAVKYLSEHKEEIPKLLSEIKERNMVYSEDVPYSDDFHETLLLALLRVQDDNRQYLENMNATNPDFYNEIQRLVSEHGKVVAFKKYCDKYSKEKGLQFNGKRQIISYGYLSIFGIEGISEQNLSENSAIMKYKSSYYIKDYINTYLERLEPEYKENLANSIFTTFNQLEAFGDIASDIEKHNEKMRRIGLPGLGYATDGKEKSLSGSALPKVKDLMSKKNLLDLDIDVLLRLNSFYNNRFAKVINDYAMAVFFIDNLNLIEDVYQGNFPTKETVSEETLDKLMLKYKTLILPIKSYYAKTQRDIEENPDQFDDMVQTIDTEDRNLESKKQVVLDLDEFIDELKDSWKDKYADYFDDVLPGVKNDLKQDIYLTNILYNPVFLSYRFKNHALKAEYAYLHYLSQRPNSKSLNFGIVMKNEKDWAKRTILLASDGGTNLSNRSHTIRRDFLDYVVAQTGKPLVRVYEGFKDFTVGQEYISSKILLPTAKQHTKYLRELKKDKLKEKGDAVSKITVLNKDFIDHVCYCADSSQFMQKYSLQENKLDKKGNVIVQYTQPKRYIDLTSGILYLQKENGRLEDKNGNVYGEDTKGIDRDE